MASLDPARLSYEVAAATSGQSTARGGSSAMASYSEGPDDLAFDLEDEECTMEIKSEPVAKKGLLGLRAGERSTRLGEREWCTVLMLCNPQSRLKHGTKTSSSKFRLRRTSIYRWQTKRVRVDQRSSRLQLLFTRRILRRAHSVSVQPPRHLSTASLLPLGALMRKAMPTTRSRSPDTSQPPARCRHHTRPKCKAPEKPPRPIRAQPRPLSSRHTMPRTPPRLKNRSPNPSRSLRTTRRT